MSDGLARLQEAYRQGGLSGLGSSLTGYLRWRLSGAPVEVADEPLAARLDKTDSAVAIVLMKDYYSRAVPVTSPLISVILPTRDRPERLAKAVTSVLEQNYDNWELVVINDSDRPEREFFLPEHSRISVIDSGGIGASGARNRGLDHASGELVCFLDDDNLMDPLWLQALAVTADESPQADVFIGAQLVTPDPGYHEHHSIRFPPRFEWEVLIRDNYVDMGMLAHRADPDLRFDESLPALVDWDYVVRLTIDTSPVLVPAISGLYLTDAPSRISYTDRQDLVEEMRNRFIAMRPIEPTLAQREIGHHDVAALKTMLGRLGKLRGTILRVITGDDTALVRSVVETMVEAGVAVATDRDPADVVIVESSADPSLADALRDGGFVVGLRANRVDYSTIGLPHTRPVGDHLWIGSRQPFNPEDLFEGATLVKFGLVDDR